jgi:hypothetical protein
VYGAALNGAPIGVSLVSHVRFLRLALEASAEDGVIVSLYHYTQELDGVIEHNSENRLLILRYG